MGLKTKIINKIIKLEGGYVNDSKDSGGVTRYGITQRVARKNGYKGEMINFPLWMAHDIYDKKYLTPISFNEIETLSPIVAEKLADISVNMGISRAGEFLQDSLNVLNRGGKDYADLKVDGQIGKKSVKALRKYLKKRFANGESVLFKMLNALQGAFYIELAKRRVKDERFIFGWFDNRIA